MLRLTLRTAVAVGVLSVLMGPVPARGAATSGPATLWASQFDRDHGDDNAVAVTTSPDGSLVFVTGTSTGQFTRQDYSTVAYDAGTGAVRWAKPYDFTSHGDDLPVGIAASPDGARVFVAGISTGPGGQTDYATVAYDAVTGQREWVKRYHGPGNGNDRASAIAVSPDSTLVYVTGSSEDESHTWDDATIAYDAAGGERVWIRRFGTRNHFDAATALAVSHDGSFVVVTGISFKGRHGDSRTVAYDGRTGDQRWSSDYSLRGEYDATAVAVSPGDSEAVITGCTTFHGCATVAYDPSSGNQLWATRSLIHGAGEMEGLAFSPDGSRLFVENEFFVTMALDGATGARLWSKTYGTVGAGGESRDIAVSPDGSQTYVEGWSQDGLAYTTLAYDSATGTTDWVRHFEAPDGRGAQGMALSVAPDGSALYVTGFISTDADRLDYGTVAYGLG
jgi:WD40 repeat protein